MEESRGNIIAYLWKERFFSIMLFNGIIYLVASLLSTVPQVVMPVGLFLGLVNLSVMNSIQPRNVFVGILKIILVTLLGSLLGMLFLQGSCLVLKNPVCSTNNLRATTFGIFFFAQIMVIGLSICTPFSKNTKSS